MADHRTAIPCKLFDSTRIPVIVGAAQITDTSTPPAQARSPLDLMADVARAAAADAGPGHALLRALDSLVVVRMFSDSTPRFKSPFGRVANPPWSVAQRIGTAPRELVYTPGGGNMPQVTLNRACERIARGESTVALLTGAEALRTELAAKRAGLQLDWNEDAPAAPEEWGGHRFGFSEHEAAHGMRAAINMYPLFEQAIRGLRGRSIQAHASALGCLFAPFAAVAHENPLATRRQGYTAEQIATTTEENPIIGFPYTKLMTASAYVDQAAAVLVCSAAKADELGVPPSKRVYLHGCAEGHDHWYVTERANLHSSPAIRRVATRTFNMAEKTLADVTCFDLYSCFPSAVEITCQEIGLPEDDPRDFTVTGGLPYFGGPGNNYVMHSIAEMVHRLRRQPGTFGLVTANGNYVTKHAFGLYSTTPLTRPWQREDPNILQRELDQLPKAPFNEKPNGAATIETYAVIHSKSGPELGIIVGRLKENETRFIANTPSDPALLTDLETRDALGLPGTVQSTDGRNLFVPERAP
ncbi:MAG TPA: acetyl-CoA acetyltransferase [Bryobacteraceae bacterium]|nr:acetyl-CoA acetyltransferase [Bryobacteraceae bacterium]